MCTSVNGDVYMMQYMYIREREHRRLLWSKFTERPAVCRYSFFPTGGILGVSRVLRMSVMSPVCKMSNLVVDYVFNLLNNVCIVRRTVQM